MKINPILFICLFCAVVCIYVFTGCPDNNNINPGPTGTPDPVNPGPTATPDFTIPEILYIKGNLFDEDGTETFTGYHIECSPPGGSVQTVTTDLYGLYQFTAPGGAQDIPFEVRDEDNILKGTFEISVKNDGSLDLSKGISINGIGFNTTIPSIRTEEPSGPGIPQPYSSIPAGTSTYKAAILEVVHRRVIERLVKAGRRLGIYGPTDKYTTTLDGPGGGHVIYTILADETNVTNQHYAPDNPTGDCPDCYFHYNGSDYYSYPAPTSDPGIFRDRIHLFRFYDYTENGLKVKGNVAFVFGYEDYPSSYDAYIYSTALDA